MDDLDDFGLPLWPAPERNKQPILEQLLKWVPQGPGVFLEISAATGQHALHFAPYFKSYEYWLSDLDDAHLAVLEARIKHSQIPNLCGPVRLDVTDDEWPLEEVDVIYNANMMHIAPFAAVHGLFRGAGKLLQKGARLITYGPYKIDGKHTSQSNEEFDASLRSRNVSWGIRDLGEVSAVAEEHGLELLHKEQMPANNFLLVWQKR